MLLKTRNEFIRAYITSALWSSTLDDGSPMDDDYSDTDLSSDCIQTMEADCNSFLSKYGATIEQAIDANGVKFGPDFGPWGRAGHDFWLTRNHHGSGYFDGDWDDPWGDMLSDASHAMKEVYLYVQDEKVYCE